MLAIRMQRTGRKGHAMFRMVVQDARRTPTSGKVIAYIGSYDPHAKKLIIKKDKAVFYLEHGAQPSARVVRLLQSEKVKLPEWVADAKPKQSEVRNPEKRRSTKPKTEETPVAAEPNETPQTETVAEPEATQESVEPADVPVAGPDQEKPADEE